MSIKSYTSARALLASAREQGYSPEDVAVLDEWLMQHVAERYSRHRKMLLESVPVGHVHHDLTYLATKVERLTGIKRDLFLGKRRQPAVVKARRVFVWAACVGTPATLPEIAAFLGRPGGHASVIFLRDTCTETERAMGNACANNLRVALSVTKAFTARPHKALAEAV